MSSTTSIFVELFRGRSDAHGAVHGECIKRALTHADWESHLIGNGSLGIYPLVPRDHLESDDEALIQKWEDACGVGLGQWWCRWGCTDIDVGYEAGWPMAQDLVAALSMLGITAWVERTKGKGWHVWVFAQQWTPAEVMRRALLAAHQVADVPTTEVNPKQVDPSNLKAGLGNYVNIPYAASFAADGKRVMVQNGEPMSVDEFVWAAKGATADPQVLLSAAQLYVPPPPPRRVVVGAPYDGSLDSVVSRLGGLAHEIFLKGPLEARDGKAGRDRSSTLQRLAHLCAEDGLHASETMAVLLDADLRWGKFHARADGQTQLEKMVGCAHGKART